MELKVPATHLFIYSLLSVHSCQFTVVEFLLIRTIYFTAKRHKSLGISTQIIDSSNSVLFAQATYSSIFAFWAQTFITNLPTGRHITLKVKVKGNLVGEGVTISMCGENIYGSLKQSAFTPKISGDFDWT